MPTVPTGCCAHATCRVKGAGRSLMHAEVGTTSTFDLRSGTHFELATCSTINTYVKNIKAAYYAIHTCMDSIFAAASENRNAN